MSAQTDLHNRLAGPIVASIVRPIMERSDASPTDVLVLLESVVAGVMLAIVKLGGDEPVVDLFAEGVKSRLAGLRLTDADTAGEA